MTSDAILVVRMLFRLVWSLFTSWHIPGTNITPAVAGFYLIMVSMVLRWIKHRLVGTDVVDTYEQSDDS